MSAHAEGAAAPLAGRLRDLHLPEPIGWWPPAPGWWALGAVALAVGAWALARAARSLRHVPARDELQACYDEWCDTRDTARYYLHSARALRRAAIGIGGRVAVARLHGERWVDWLERHAAEPFPGEVREVLADAGYRRCPPDHVTTVHRELSRWVGERRAAQVTDDA